MNIPVEKEILVVGSKNPVKKSNNILMRLLSGICIITLFISSIIYHQPKFIYVINIIGVIMLYEWHKMKKFLNIKHLCLGIIIILPSILSLSLLDMKGYSWHILCFFIMVWSLDTFAMIAGKTFKGPKLAPRISPNKTWSGLIIGTLLSTVITMSTIKIIGNNFQGDNSLLFNRFTFLAIILLCIIAQMSDLFISYFKRKFNIKDSGTIIPGHGGMLDRFDSVILTAPILFCLINYL